MAFGRLQSFYFLGTGIGIFDLNILSTKLKIKMNNLLYIIAVILVIGWLIGVFAYSATGIIHVLLVIAIIATLFKVIGGRSF